MPAEKDDLIELVVVGAGRIFLSKFIIQAHALSLLAALLETTPDPYGEHPDNELLFYYPKDFPESARRVVNAGLQENHRQLLAKYDPRSLTPSKFDKTRIMNIVKKREIKDDYLFYNRAENHDNRDILHYKLPSDWLIKKIMVCDKLANKNSTNNWMQCWDRFFSTFRIPHLRSPFNHHPDAGSPMLLWYYAQFHGKMDQFTSLVVEKEDLLESDCRESRGPFLLPGTTLFRAFINDAIIHRHKLENVVKHGDVKFIEPKKYFRSDENNAARAYDYYEVHYADGSSVAARNVVMATGNSGACRSIPEWVNDANEKALHPTYSLVHCFDIALHECSYFDQISDNLKTPTEYPLAALKIVVIGGGLTRFVLSHVFNQSLNLAKCAHEKGCQDITILSRKKMRIQPFDVIYKWIGPDRNRHMAAFWSTKCPKARINMFARAKFPSEKASGEASAATVTREGIKLVQDACEQGHCKIEENCEVINAYWSETSRWSIKLSNNSVMNADLIWLATGVKFDIMDDPMYEKVVKLVDIPTVNGLPILRNDLALSKSYPGLYVMGQYAAYQLGPGAGNLMGGRTGAIRISRTLKKRLHGVYINSSTHSER